MTESEKTLERNLVNRLDKMGGWAVKLLAVHITGLPDRLCLWPGGRVVFVEMKSTGKTVRPSQAAIHRKLRAMGFRVEVIDSTKGIDKLFKLMEE